MNIKKVIFLLSAICSVGIVYAIYSLKSLLESFESDFDDEESLDGEV